MTTLEQCIGNTPLVQLQRLAAQAGSEVWVKLEGNNPAGSVKDRAALAMIQQAELRGEIKPGDVLIEATSGNTGIALAMIAALKGYTLKLLMPENMSLERQAAMRAYGAELILVSREQGMEGARDLALEMQRQGQGKVLDQFNNLDNPYAHFTTTGPEIWRQTEGRITHFVSSMGTTGTITGVGRLPEEPESAGADHRPAAGRRQQHPRHSPLGACLPAGHFPPGAGGSGAGYRAARCRADHAPAGAA